MASLVETWARLEEPGTMGVRGCCLDCPVVGGYTGEKQRYGNHVDNQGDHAPVDLVMTGTHPAEWQMEVDKSHTPENKIKKIVKSS